MPATHFYCPDGRTVEIKACLSTNGCRMSNRCATRPYLELIGFDREFKGVSPSSAGNGPRQIYLKATQGYAIDPNDRVWAAFGTSTHDKLGMHKYIHNVFSEEKLSDDEMRGIADLLEMDEGHHGLYILSDYKTWGSFKVAKALGIVVNKTDEPILDEKGNQILLKSGKNKGKPKTKIKSEIITDPSKVDLKSEELQINRYRMFFEKCGFPVSRMQIQAVPRDGGTYIAKSRGIEKNLYIIPVNRLSETEVLEFYRTLSNEVEEGFKAGFVRKCNFWESWEGRKCDGYCEVSEDCKSMDKTQGA